MKVLTILLIMFGFFSSGSPLETRSISIREDPRLQSGKPTVNITFEDIDRPTKRSKVDSGLIGLRLNNNTIWALQLRVGGKRESTINQESLTTSVQLRNGFPAIAFQNGTKYDACYEVEAEKQVLEFGPKVPNPKVPQGHSCTGNTTPVWLRSGHSVLFSVPRLFVADRLLIYLTYNYE